jgi:curved DNA-binding protein CbpA
MTDCFALLEESRRPWLDAAEIRQKFLTRSTDVHPDRFHQAAAEDRSAAEARYSELNRAHETLASSRNRLRHLIELERGIAPTDIQQTPPELMELFFACGKLCQGVDAFLSRRDQADSPLLKVALFQEGMDWSDQVQELNDRVTARRADLEGELQRMNLRWDAERERVLDELEGIYRNLSYYERWQGQLQARFVRLAT